MIQRKLPYVCQPLATTWLLTLSYQLSSCVYVRTKLMKKLKCNLTEEEDSSSW